MKQIHTDTKIIKSQVSDTAFHIKITMATHRTLSHNVHPGKYYRKLSSSFFVPGTSL